MATGKHYWFRFLDVSKVDIIEKTIDKMAIDLKIEPSILRTILFEIIATDYRNKMTKIIEKGQKN